MVLIYLVAFLLILVTSLIHYINSKKPKKFPPGPWLNLPLVGHLPLISDKPYLTFWNWSKMYNSDIISVQLGSYSTVILHGHKLIREAMNNYDFSGRPNIMFLQEPSGGRKGMFAADGSSFTEQKRFVMKNLLTVDVRKSAMMEGLLQSEVQDFIDGLAKTSGQPIDNLHNKLLVAVLSAIWGIVTGDKYHQDDPRIAELVFKISQFTATPANSAMIFMPWIAKIAPDLSGWTLLKDAADDTRAYLLECICRHKETLDLNNPRDFVDRYLIEISKTTDRNSGFFGQEGVQNLVAVLVDLFTAGSETIGVALSWVFLYVTYYPEIQLKLQEEIDRVIGNRQATFADKAKMPYTEAIITEMFRHSAIIPISAFHCTMRDLDFKGYKIPKDTVVLCNNYASHHDPKIWGDPENFRPQRFLSNNNEEFENKNCEAILAFSAGKRACMGESLAKTELFLFLVGVYQRFWCTFDASEPPPTLEPLDLLIMQPQPYKIVFHERTK